MGRVFRRAFPQTKIFGLDLWFQLHRFFMIFCSVFTIISIIVIFATRGGWSASAGSHAVVGIIVFVLTVINPIVAMFRPSPKAGKLPIT